MRLITKKELAAKLSLSLDQIEQAVAKGLVPPPIQLDGHMRWADELIDNWIRAGCPEKIKQEDNDKNNKMYDRPGTLRNIEKEAITNALNLVGGNREKAARLLEIGERTLYRKIKEYGLG